METKKQKIKKLVIEMLNDSNEKAIKKLDALLDSGAVDAELWDEGNAPMILPKTIVTALLEYESRQYSARGTSYEKQIKKDVRNMVYFI